MSHGAAAAGCTAACCDFEGKSSTSCPCSQPSGRGQRRRTAGAACCSCVSLADSPATSCSFSANAQVSDAKAAQHAATTRRAVSAAALAKKILADLARLCAAARVFWLLRVGVRESEEETVQSTDDDHCAQRPVLCLPFQDARTQGYNRTLQRGEKVAKDSKARYELSPPCNSPCKPRRCWPFAPAPQSLSRLTCRRAAPLSGRQSASAAARGST